MHVVSTNFTKTLVWKHEYLKTFGGTELEDGVK